MGTAVTTLMTSAELLTEIPSDLIRGIGTLSQIIDGTPESLRDVAHYAFIFNVSDDIERSRLISSLSPTLRSHLIQIMAERDDKLDHWLAGPEAHGDLSTAYLAFTHLRMTADGV